MDIVALFIFDWGVLFVIWGEMLFIYFWNPSPFAGFSFFPVRSNFHCLPNPSPMMVWSLPSFWCGRLSMKEFFFWIRVQDFL